MISLVWFEISGSLKGFLVVDGVFGPTSTLNQPPPDVAGRARASALQATKPASSRFVPLRIQEPNHLARTGSRHAYSMSFE
jgi:hypothetical protein